MRSRAPRLSWGHEIVPAPSELLTGFCDRFAAVQLAATCTPPAYATLDGVRIYVAFASGQAEATFRWVEGDAPPQWLELDRLAHAFLYECEVLLGAG